MAEHLSHHPRISEYRGVNGGYPVAASTRIAVLLTVDAFRESRTPDETADTLARLHHAVERGEAGFLVAIRD